MGDTTQPQFSYSSTIQLPGTLGDHGDWVAFDPATQTIWIAQSPDNSAVVIDARTDTVDVWHYTNAGDFRLSFVGALEQVAASVGNGGSLAASFSDLVQSAGSSSASAMFPNQISVGKGNGQGNGPLADQVPNLSSFLTDLNQGHAASAVSAIFGHGG